MLEFTATIGLFAGILKFIGFVPYIISILRKKTRPSRATWFVWMTLASILYISYRQSGATDTLWAPLAAVFATITIALLSIKYGVGGWTPFDRKCLFAAGVGLFLWFLFDQPLLAVLSSLAVDLIGALPTIKKVWTDSESEDKLSWGIFWLSSLANVFAIGQWTFAVAIYPLAMLVS